MKSLIEFYNDRETCKNVEMFLLQHLEKIALSKVFAREDVSGIADARVCIEEAFEAMSAEFEKRPEKNIINEAR